MNNKQTFVQQGQSVIELAREIGGWRVEGSVLEQELSTLNGLLAIAVVEVISPPAKPDSGLYSPLRLGEVLT